MGNGASSGFGFILEAVGHHRHQPWRRGLEFGTLGLRQHNDTGASTWVNQALV